MPMPLKIERWSFWSPEASNPREWQALEHHDAGTVSPAAVPAELVPAMHRRRMSALSRMAVQTALAVSENLEVDFAVFCSRHGELVRTNKLLASICEGEVLSPIEFSQSVHNTSAGLYSIVRKTRNPTSSIAAGAASFANGWLEAEGFLSENPAGRVLLVDCDQSLPSEYASFVHQHNCNYALALVLTSGSGDGIQLKLEASNRESSRPMGPQFLSWWLSQAPQLGIDAEGQRFTWVRGAES